MSLEQNLESDILKFFRDIDTQNDNDRLQTLRLLIDKYIHLTKSEMLMDKHDLEVIISRAKSIIVEKTFPITLGKTKRKVHPEEQVALCVIESTISYLNKNQCLKRLPKFDYREDKI